MCPLYISEGAFTHINSLNYPNSLQRGTIPILQTRELRPECLSNCPKATQPVYGSTEADVQFPVFSLKTACLFLPRYPCSLWALKR